MGKNIAGLVITTIALALTACSKEQAEEVAEEVTEAAEEVMEDVSDATEEMIDEATEVA